MAQFIGDLWARFMATTARDKAEAVRRIYADRSLHDDMIRACPPTAEQQAALAKALAEANNPDNDPIACEECGHWHHAETQCDPRNVQWMREHANDNDPDEEC